MTTEMRIQEGDLGIMRPKNFFTLFRQTADKAVEDISDLKERRKAREFLCAIFQVI